MTKRTNNETTAKIDIEDVLIDGGNAYGIGFSFTREEREILLDKLEEIAYCESDCEVETVEDFRDSISNIDIYDLFFWIDDAKKFISDFWGYCNDYVKYMFDCGISVNPFDNESAFACGVLFYLIDEYVDMDLFYEYAKQEYKANN